MIILSPSFAWVSDVQSLKLWCGWEIKDCHKCTCPVTWIHSLLSISLPGVKKPLGQYGPAGVQDTTSAAPAAADEDDDDIDLFGSDEEEVSAVAELMVWFDRIIWSRDDFLTIFRLMLWWTPFCFWKPVNGKMSRQLLDVCAHLLRNLFLFRMRNPKRSRRRGLQHTMQRKQKVCIYF